MAGIGERLREARGLRGLDISEAARQLGVPSKDLRALEWERFDLLPSAEDVERLLAAYQALLGLDGGHVLHERPATGRRVRRALVRGAAALALGVAFGTGVTVLAHELGGREQRPDAPRAAAATPRPPSPSPAPPTPPSEPVAAAPKRATLVVNASGGDSWVEARAGSSDGESLYQGLLSDGRSVKLVGDRLWLRLGAAGNVDLTLDGKHLEDGFDGTIELVATRDGVRAAR